MHPQLAALIDLQSHDAAIQVETDRIQSIPKLIEAVESRARELDARLEAGKEGLKAAQKERRHIEGEVDLIKQKLSKYQGQLMEVKTNEQYKAMLHEIDATKAEVAAREEKILEKMLLIDELEAQVKGLEKGFQADHRKLDEEKAALEAQRREAEERRATLQAERGDLTSRLDAEVLVGYQRVARQRQGLAVVEAREELCLGCRVKLRPQVFQEVLLGSEIHLCDSCGRFLYCLPAPSEPRTAPEPPSPPSTEAGPPDEPAG